MRGIFQYERILWNYILQHHPTNIMHFGSLPVLTEGGILWFAPEHRKIGDVVIFAGAKFSDVLRPSFEFVEEVFVYGVI